MLVVMMMSGQWGCHRAHLRLLLAECYDMAEGLTALGCQWVLRHVYREYTTVADKLAGDCIHNLAAASPSPLWSLQSLRHLILGAILHKCFVGERNEFINFYQFLQFR